MNEMMKRTVILALLLSAMLFSGCDMFRRLAGRPTAEELDRMSTRPASILCVRWRRCSRIPFLSWIH